MKKKELKEEIELLSRRVERLEWQLARVNFPYYQPTLPFQNPIVSHGTSTSSKGKADITFN
jgi:hypothetical protein